MWELMNTLPFIIGSCISSTDPHFVCFMLLDELMALLFSPVIALNQVSYLGYLIRQCLEHFTTLYPNRPLTPKCHFLVHIPGLIKRYNSCACCIALT